MEHGKVQESGTHASLMARGGRYYELIKKQDLLSWKFLLKVKFQWNTKFENFVAYIWQPIFEITDTPDQENSWKHLVR